VAVEQQITQQPWLPAQYDDETTRLLCASARLHPVFAGEVLASVAGERYRAIAPSYGVDLVALVRHAARSRRTYFRRNLAHTALLLIGLVALGIVLLSARSITPLVLLVGATAVLAWTVELVDLWTARREALKVVETYEVPASLAAPIDQDLERRLPRLDRMNVVVYGADRHYPFVGSGLRITSWAVPPVDVGKGKPDEHGERRKTVPFDAVQLHRHLANAVGARGPTGLNVSNRLYVRGPEASDVQGLLGGRLGTPERIVGLDVIESALRHPQSTVQTYLCLERIAFGGQLAVSVFVHAVLERDLLTVMADCFFLPPLQRRCWAALGLPRRRSLVLGRTMADAAGTFPRDLLVAPAELVRYWLRKVARRYRFARDSYRVQHRRSFDYGAARSIREDMADITAANHVHLVNVERYLRVLQRHVIDALLEFLDGHNVDTSDLREQQNDIINATFYNFYGSVHGRGHVFGSHAQQINNPGSPPGGNPAGQQP
jgi:hypothetical protein